MSVQKVHHIGIGVPDLAASIAFYTFALGLDSVERIDWPELGLRAAAIPFGETILELIEPVAPQGVIAEDLGRLVRERGGGVHHLAIEVEDIDAAVARLKVQGVRMLDEVPHSVAGGRIAWLRSNTAAGALIELVETGYQIC